MHQAQACFVAERHHSNATSTATHITCTNTYGASTHSHAHVPGGSGLGSHVVTGTADYLLRDCGSVGLRSGTEPPARKEMRGLPVVRRTTGRTSCGTRSGSDLPSTYHGTPPRTVQHRPFSTYHNGRGWRYIRLWVCVVIMGTWVWERLIVQAECSITSTTSDSYGTRYSLHLCGLRVFLRTWLGLRYVGNIITVGPSLV